MQLVYVVSCLGLLTGYLFFDTVSIFCNFHLSPGDGGECGCIFGNSSTQRLAKFVFAKLWAIFTFWTVLTSAYFIMNLSSAIKMNDPDAYFLWFFLAKYMYFTGSMELRPLGLMPLTFHLDYPRIIPAFSALSAWYAGRWNEYLPKLGCAIIVATGFCGLFSVFEKRITFLLSFVCLPRHPKRVVIQRLHGWVHRSIWGPELSLFSQSGGKRNST